MKTLRLPLSVGPGRPLNTLPVPIPVIFGSTSGDGLAAVPLDSEMAVAQSVALLLRSIPGERRSVPGYGLPDALGDGVEPDEIVEAVEEWEPRAEATFVEQVAGAPEQFLRVYPTATPAATDDEEA